MQGQAQSGMGPPSQKSVLFFWSASNRCGTHAGSGSMPESQIPSSGRATHPSRPGSPYSRIHQELIIISKNITSLSVARFSRRARTAILSDPPCFGGIPCWPVVSQGGGGGGLSWRRRRQVTARQRSAGVHTGQADRRGGTRCRSCDESTRCANWHTWDQCTRSSCTADDGTIPASGRPGWAME